MKLWPLILLLPFVAFAQDDPWEDDVWDEDWDDTASGLLFSGFVEGAFGTRFSEDELVPSRNTLEDFRWRLETEWRPDKFTISFKADAGFDGIEDDWFLEFRDLSVSFSPGDSTDMQIGRQVQTWGTGDLVFLNDLFPKDFVSFFSGRDDEYLKAPGNAVRVTHYAAVINVDFVWTPVFEPDVYLTGERFSFFSPLAGANVAPNPPLEAIEPDKSFSNGEFALRLFRTIEGNEYAFYAYSGFFKQPTALTSSLEPTFAPLSAYGASLRRTLGPGLFNTEFSYYDSRDDRDGTEPLLPNDQARVLLGYEWEARQNFTVGLQYYLEWTLDHDELIANSPFPQFEPDEYRHLLTNRLTYRAGMEKYTWSLFTFFSPSDSDFYVRPQFTYRHSDRWSMTTGGNLFGGNEPQTFFNQLQDASNVYLRVRFNY
jgi:hypothetical protein